MMIRRPISILILVSLLFAVSPAHSRTLQLNYPSEYSREKATEVLSARASAFIDSKAVDGLAKVWVFFTDRGIESKADFSRIASSVAGKLTDRALDRRAKVGKDKVSIVDIPVSAEYVSAIENLGATLRRTSRYLNAASFEVPLAVLGEIADLPFVAEIRPMLGYKKDYSVSAELIKKLEQDQSLAPTDFSYGASYDQLNQVNVIPAHNAGYNGAGVMVAMFDTGFRTTHRVFQNIIMSGRLIAERDFIYDDLNVDNEPEDVSSAWDHGTLTWSTLGGEWSANHYGPAFGASFVLAKTEDVRSETPVEEDNWVAALEWADSIGVDVISSSLGYTDWYSAEDYDGNTATTTVAADLAAEYGIVVCNSAGNNGPSASSLGAPADADSIIAVGAVYSTGGIVSFSSRGPTSDGRIKPEVCARGSGTACASSSGDLILTSASGTSLSCPIIGGVTALVIDAHPSWTAMQVRDAIMLTANNAANPNNNYGWGIANCWQAINYSQPIDYIIGDANHSDFIDIDDIVYLINYAFGGGPEPMPILAVGNVNGDTEVDVDDITYLINYVFGGGPPPMTP